MNGWVWFITAGLAVVIIALLMKVYLLKKSAREIRTAFIEKNRKGYKYADSHIRP